MHTEKETYRHLTPSEVAALTAQGVSCDDWTRLRVKEGFITGSVRDASFSGDVYLGIFRRPVTFAGNFVRRAGIYNATVHNCIIEDDAYIYQVKNYIANYRVCREVVIECVDTLAVNGTTRFGNGTRVSVLAENGGREIPIYNELSAHAAYLAAFYRHRPALIERLSGMVDDHARRLESSTGIIGEGAWLSGCRTIINVNIGARARVEGVYRLEEGTINSSADDPAYVGPGVIAEHFITSSGSSVSESSVIARCFVGQGTVLGKQYSAEHSVFAANCQGFHGEACSIFAGPYTVSHHKSTLLIAAYFAFLNAGSGSNQSNHMYKLGPIHQGIIERGSKTASDSYILWPAKIGAFSLVMGRHYRNLDTSDMPFSYIIENTDESFLAPGVTLRSIGTIRDVQKWPQRDRRVGPRPLDNIIFNMLSPYSVQKMIKGRDILLQLERVSGRTSEHYMYNSAKITHRALKRGLYLYRLGITKFLGNGIVNRLAAATFDTLQEAREILAPTSEAGTGEWADIAGLLVPEEEVGRLIAAIERGDITTPGVMNDTFREWKQRYDEWAWNWTVSRLQSEAGIDLRDVLPARLEAFVGEWKEAVVTLDRLMFEDARKEFTLKSRVGFGIDGTEETRLSDFENVRGEFDDHPAVRGILEHIERKSRLHDTVRDKLARLRPTNGEA
ncbi:MAG: DUF4954 family protein [Odoribacteraceae bacterium]|jgi:hypothetical protein|nr:DUF4954 family protein [Odoribacteraceae bacterium]